MLSVRSTYHPMEVSKWLSFQLLIDGDEMQSLFEALGEFSIYKLGTVVNRGEENIDPQVFLEQWSRYIKTLKEGEVPEDTLYRPYFTTVFSTAPQDDLFVTELQGGRCIVRVARPVIQLQLHKMSYSPLDGKFRSMTLGSENLTWGIQLSYPQLFMNQETHQVEKVALAPGFPNTRLFKALQRWIRYHTLPTPFLVEGKKVNVPVRLGEKCCSWINCHAQMRKKGIMVVVDVDASN